MLFKCSVFAGLVTNSIVCQYSYLTPNAHLPLASLTRVLTALRARK